MHKTDVNSQRLSDFRVTFSTEDVSDKDRFAFWLDKIEAFFDVDKEPFKGTQTGFRGSLGLLQCSDVLFGEVRAQGQLFMRDQRRILQDGLDHFILQVFVEGGGPIEDGPNVEPGDIIVIDMGRQHARESWPHHTLSFVIPRDKDPELTFILERLHNRKLPKAHPLTRMIYAQMKMLWDVQGDMTVRQMQTALDSTLEFFKTNLAQEIGTLGTQHAALSSTALLHSIRTYIEQNLGSALSVERICAQFRISRAQVYRLFQEEGGVMRYVQQRRLARSYQMLAKSGAEQSIIGVAAQMGFKSDSHFTRSFKAEFGLTPTEARQQVRETGKDLGRDRSLIDRWLTDLSAISPS